jgi:molecular chaperone DnaJ
MPRLDGRGRGDLRVHVSVEIPKKLSADERRVFEELAKVRGEEVGGEVPGIFRRIRDTLRGS